jgi:uncharacterized protein (DUF2225 family)
LAIGAYCRETKNLLTTKEKCGEAAENLSKLPRSFSSKLLNNKKQAMSRHHDAHLFFVLEKSDKNKTFRLSRSICFFGLCKKTNYDKQNILPFY